MSDRNLHVVRNMGDAAKATDPDAEILIDDVRLEHVERLWRAGEQLRIRVRMVQHPTLDGILRSVGSAPLFKATVLHRNFIPPFRETMHCTLQAIDDLEVKGGSAFSTLVFKMTTAPIQEFV